MTPPYHPTISVDCYKLELQFSWVLVGGQMVGHLAKQKNSCRLFGSLSPYTFANIQVRVQLQTTEFFLSLRTNDGIQGWPVPWGLCMHQNQDSVV